jgi:hypothetical protein
MAHYQASAVIGPAAANSGGWLTAALGIAVHFTLTTVMAGLFVAAARKFPALLREPWLSGPAYGLLIYFVMTYIAVPLSAAPNWKPATGWSMVGGLLAHCFYVGLPIAAIARALLLDPRATGATTTTHAQPSPQNRVSAPGTLQGNQP